MPTYDIVSFGDFHGCDVRAIVDSEGKHWFTKNIIAGALGIDKGNVVHVRSNNSSEFIVGEDYKYITHNKKKVVVYSEEGFLTICDLSSSKRAYRLRKWMRSQFRVKSTGNGIIVHHKHEKDDYSDLDDDLAMTQKLLDRIIEDRQRMKSMQRAHDLLSDAVEEANMVFDQRITKAEKQLEAIEDKAVIHPGEMTATQLATHCKWYAPSGSAHNLAVILAAMNHNFLDRDLMRQCTEEVNNGRLVECWVFSPEGMSEFIKTIDSAYSPGQRFQIEPNDISRKMSYKNRRNVRKG